MHGPLAATARRPRCQPSARLEWGWRFVPEARGRGYATEATTALLDVAGACDSGEVLCIIAADNHACRRVAEKTGFRWWKRVNYKSALHAATVGLPDRDCSQAARHPTSVSQPH